MNPSDMLAQFQPPFRRFFIVTENGLALGAILLTNFKEPMERPLPLAMFATAGYLLAIVGVGLLISRAFRDLILYPGYSLEGHRLLLAAVGFAGTLIGLGATAMLIGSNMN